MFNSARVLHPRAYTRTRTPIKTCIGCSIIGMFAFFAGSVAYSKMPGTDEAHDRESQRSIEVGKI